MKKAIGTAWRINISSENGYPELLLMLSGCLPYSVQVKRHLEVKGRPTNKTDHARVDHDVPVSLEF